MRWRDRIARSVSFYQQFDDCLCYALRACIPQTMPELLVGGLNHGVASGFSVQKADRTLLMP